MYDATGAASTSDGTNVIDAHLANPLARTKKSQPSHGRASARGVSRRLATVLLLLGPFTGCGTDATGVDACLKIERERCKAADACGVSDGTACERYVEVQCLHGFVKSALPNEKQTNQCASALGQLAECAIDRGSKTSVEACDLEVDDSAPARACDLVDDPHELRACRFLASENEDENEDETQNGSDENEETPSQTDSAPTDGGGDSDPATSAEADAGDANP